jgi:hypothetical protein
MGSPNRILERIVLDYFKTVDLIVHLGDYVDYSVASYLMDHKKLVGVAGNMDPQEIRSTFPFKQVLELGEFRIGLIHGWGPPHGLEDKILNEFMAVDAILYGHTHEPANHTRKGLLYFNPGSPTRSVRGESTIGMLRIENTIRGEIIRL